MFGKFKYEYYISYFYSSNGVDGLGSTNLQRNRKINTDEDIASVINYIKNDCKCDDAILLSWRRLKFTKGE